jgi:pyruvate/2-oxoglutarate dehydrogenase complex dihydrolipoamide acyltransferase (E2) component
MTKTSRKQPARKRQVVATNPETLTKLMTMQARAALPAVGQTTNNNARTDLNTPDASGLNLSLPECADRLGWSLKTAYRKARSGQLVGAHKAMTATGEAWQVPVATVAAIAQAQAAKTTKTTQNAEQTAILQQQVRDLELELASVRAQAHERGVVVEQLQSTMRALTVATEQLSQVNDERAKTLELTQAALAAAINRKWWQRIKPTPKPGN